MKIDWNNKKTRDWILLIANILAVIAFLVLAYIDFTNANVLRHDPCYLCGLRNDTICFPNPFEYARVK